METTPKKVSRPYRKLPKTFTTINVQNYLSATSANPAKSCSVRHLLLRYLNEHRNAEFSNHREIGNALRKEYNLDDSACTKSAISKAVNAIQGDLIFPDGTYYFTKLERTYQLRPRFESNNPILTSLFDMENTFLKSVVHTLNKNTYVFSVHPDKLITVKDKFYTLLGSEACFGIAAHDSFLTIMLNADYPNVEMARTMLLGFFRQKAAYTKKLKDKELAKRAHKEQNAKILALRKKYGGSIKHIM